MTSSDRYSPLNRVREIAEELALAAEGAVREPDLDSLRSLLDLGASAETLEFYRVFNVRGGYLQCGVCRIASAEGLVRSNSTVPGTQLRSEGYFVIAETEFGDTIAMATRADLNLGAVYRFDHEISWDGIDAESLHAAALEEAKSLVDFLERFRDGKCGSPDRSRAGRSRTWHTIGQTSSATTRSPFAKVRARPALAAIVGSEVLTRGEVARRLLDYIKAHDLQRGDRPRLVRCDALLQTAFGKEEIDLRVVKADIDALLVDA